MIDTILALIPTYGLWIIFVTIALGCLAIPLPGSMLVLASGSFAAAGDIDLYYAMAAALGGYITGDQTAYRIARVAGPKLLDRFKDSKRAGPMICKAETLLQKRGVIAILLSRTIVTPMGPWMSYLCGAAGLKWVLFTSASILGASIWVAAYSLIGYFFADRLEELATLASDGIGFIAAFAVAIGAGWWLRISWKKYRAKMKEAEASDSVDLDEPAPVDAEPEIANANTL